MSRYIDADELIKFYEPYADMAVPVNALLEQIKDTPTADVTENVRLSPITTVTVNRPTEWVEVVRCKECKYWTGIECATRDIDVVDDDDYCSYGERKGQDDSEEMREILAARKGEE